MSDLDLDELRRPPSGVKVLGDNDIKVGPGGVAYIVTIIRAISALCDRCAAAESERDALKVQVAERREAWPMLAWYADDGHTTSDGAVLARKEGGDE